ncbi:efflux RND transporter permease subunit [Bryobacter aggregatus]|uniref:efflux RND transporter permease subunit n=1 Tax=Bryobacter aggregatus TaxID=360054 RepID=UPI0009B5A47A|nr:efflux RND transporter permease subunit [Bryobacter aggregatus]
MNVSKIFIERPIATTLLMVAIGLFGIIAYRALPVSDLPNVDLPTLLVTAQLPGASPETMASAVATPMEGQFSTIAGLASMTSTNTLGSTQITLEFELNKSLDSAAVDVQAAITQSSRLLPPGMPTPPTFAKVNPADQPILYLALSSDSMPLYTLNEFAETRVAQRISQVTGVAQVAILGAQRYAVHVQMDPYAMASRLVGINEVETALKTWNVNLPTGTINGPQRAFTLQASGQLMNAEAYKTIIVAYRNGSPIRLQELGNIVDGVEDERTASSFCDESGCRRAIVLGIQRQPGTNTIAVTDAIKKLLPQFKADIPPSVEMKIFYDRSDTIRESYADVQFTMLLTLLLIIAVIYIFLRNFSATLIPSLALPFSIVGTFAVMYLCHYSLDNLSMMALILAIGFVVDDAIVMLENIVRHMEMGKPPMQAALEGAAEIGFTIVSMTISLAAVFIPILFMGGVLGRLFQEFSVTICVAILISGVVSVTLTPMLSSRFLRVSHHKSKFYLITERAFDAWLAGYDRSLKFVLRHRPATMVFSLLILVATGWLFVEVPKGFIPDQDTDQMTVITEAQEGTSFQQMMLYQNQIAEMLREDPDVESLVSNIGGTASTSLGGNNYGQIVVHLKPRAERHLLVNDIIARIRPKLAQYPGLKAYPQNPPVVRIGGLVSKSLYQYTLYSPDKEALYAAAEDLTNELSKLHTLEDVTSDLMIRSPQVKIEVDRDKAAAIQVNVNQIENALYDAYGPRWASTIYSPVNEYKVLLELMPQYQSDPKLLSMLYFKASNNNLIPLEALAKVELDNGPLAISHYGQLPAVTVSFGIRPDAALGVALDQVAKVAAEVVPGSVSASFQGAAGAFQGSLGNLWILLAVAIAVVYIVLGILYESFIHPITILSGLPSAGFGALLTLYLFKMDLSIYAFVGLIMLIGIVKKNAIMQIDFALEAEREGMSSDEAIYQGCLVRFRPIMMTTMCALLGAVPIAIGYGAGGEARQPLGLVVVGGLLFSQLVTLYLTPVVYTYLAKVAKKPVHNQNEKDNLPSQQPVPVH